jgi:hypothetical protein
MSPYLQLVAHPALEAKKKKGEETRKNSNKEEINDNMIRSN